MKKILTSITLVFSLSVATAQLTLTQNDIAGVNTSFRMENAAQPLLINPGNAGAGVTWDFSQMTSTNSFQQEYIPISNAGLTYLAVFFFSSFAEPIPAPDTLGPLVMSNIYNFYTSNGNAFLQDGFGASISGVPLPVKFTSPDTLLTFPANFGDADSSHTSFNVTIPTIGGWKRQQSRKYEVDGSGTLITPYGTFDALRIKYTLTYTDTVTFQSIPVGLTTHGVEYRWYSKNEGVPLMTLTGQDILGQETYTRGVYRNDSVTGISNENIPQFQVWQEGHHLLVNPGASVSEGVGLSIFNNLGQIMYDNTIGNRSTELIDTRLWPGGMYFVSCYDATGHMQTRKVMIY